MNDREMEILEKLITADVIEDKEIIKYKYLFIDDLLIIHLQNQSVPLSTLLKILKHFILKRESLFIIFQEILYQATLDSYNKYNCLELIFEQYAISDHIEKNQELNNCYVLANIAWEDIYYNLNDKDDPKEIKRLISVLVKYTGDFIKDKIKATNKLTNFLP